MTEINAYNVSVCCLKEECFVETKGGKLKIFNFQFITPFGEKVKNKELFKKQRVPPELIKSGIPSFKTDIWVLGVSIMKILIYKKLKNFTTENLINHQAEISLKMTINKLADEKLSLQILSMIKKNSRDRPTFSKIFKSEIFLEMFKELKIPSQKMIQGGFNRFIMVVKIKIRLIKLRRRIRDKRRRKPSIKFEVSTPTTKLLTNRISTTIDVTNRDITRKRRKSMSSNFLKEKVDEKKRVQRSSKKSKTLVVNNSLRDSP